MQAAFPEFAFLQNNCLRFENVLVVGSRGWTIPTEESDAHDVAIYRRELIRLELSLSHAERVRTPDDKVVAMLHYPPFDAKYADSEVTELLAEHRVDAVTYGHLHGKNSRVTPVLEKQGIKYYITSCDLVANTLVRIF